MTNLNRIATDQCLRRKMSRIYATLHSLYVEKDTFSTSEYYSKEYNTLLAKINRLEQELTEMRRERDEAASSTTDR